MSELLASVRSCFFHDVLGVSSHIEIIAASDSDQISTPALFLLQLLILKSSGGETQDFEANKRTLESHQKYHKVIKCAECSKYIKSGPMPKKPHECSCKKSFAFLGL